MFATHLYQERVIGPFPSRGVLLLCDVRPVDGEQDVHAQRDTVLNVSAIQGCIKLRPDIICLPFNLLAACTAHPKCLQGTYWVVVASHGGCDADPDRLAIGIADDGLIEKLIKLD